MAQSPAHGADHHDHHAAGHHDPQDLKLLGFWIFLVTDVLMFSTLFATFIVLRGGTDGGPTGAELLEINGIIISTFLLLTSSFTSGLAVLAMHQNKVQQMIIWLIVTGLLGAGFIGLELNEFLHLIHEGATLQTSAFWSSFFTLVGTHGVHVTVGLFWMIAIIIQIVRRGLNSDTKGKITVFSLYWHFLDAVWIFLLSIVYLMEVM
ncbi:cytochrome (ubi)quinol oxidase subunit III [Saccharibacillus sp. CPCC 101409]|uniref:cytochrome (ubi)quinol oxidase subunit III n=1 Tax=Saccharibacillus sp. CPCC 101409 TaxID=3058041 RepID=UPI0026729F33|nr:cytochrome (ubi)quinol oxidase subunit III [Saccharibacillus sp. CPCC 101409]MDO3412752.1 cytochrome (ubi)quinol oxidase subunit III [Saccharibacillus sp. CPCC 101409]